MSIVQVIYSCYNFDKCALLVWTCGIVSCIANNDIVSLVTTKTWNNCVFSYYKNMK